MRYTITDIHGNARTFDRLLSALDLKPTDELYLLGDYVDRGPDSKGVIDRLIQLQQDGYSVHCLRGNHEQEMIRQHEQGELMVYSDWYKYFGGRETVASYGRSDKRISEEHLAWCRELDYYFDLGDYILVHAGLNMAIRDPLSDRTAMLWHRYWYHELTAEAKDWLDGRTIVHGHTPQSRESIEHFLSDYWQQPVINIDAGCYKDEAGMGKLCALNLDTRQLTFVERVD